MAYNPYNPYLNPFPYQSPVIPQQQQVPQPAQNNQGLIWVSGEVGAKSYLMAPNSTAMLMDSESSRFFIKSTDGAGMPTIRTYEYTETPQNVTASPHRPENEIKEEYVTREEYKAIWGKFEELKKELEEMQKKPAKVKKEVPENE